MIEKACATYGTTLEHRPKWTPPTGAMKSSSYYMYQLEHMIGICITYIASMDGPIREHVILQTAAYLKHNYPSEWAAKNVKARAYCPPNQKDIPVWDGRQILFE